MTGASCRVAPVAEGRLRALERRTQDGRIPISGALELTRRCNLGCVHCYLGEDARQGAGAATEMATGDVLRLLDQAAKAGCLLLLLTGGEPLLRPDFAAVYRHARSLGLVVTVFTNATLVDDGTVALLAEVPPRMVEVSLYGATAPAHEQVTGVPGSHRRTLDGVARLLAAGVRVGLKTMVLRSNVGEIQALEALAARLGTRFRLDAVVNARVDGGRRPLAERVEPEVAVPIELRDRKRRDGYRELLERVGGAAIGDRLYACRAGVNGFHLDPTGVLRPCLMVRRIAFDARALGFAGAWRAAGEAMAGLRADPSRPCATCSLRPLCDYCPGFFELETGAPDRPAPFSCQLGAQRFRVLDDERRAAP